MAMTQRDIRTARYWTTGAATLLLAGTALCAAAAEPAVDTGWILSRIARPAPASTPFLEVRGSKLLKAPLRLTGEYRRPDADTLVREVRAPYAETTTLRAGEAVIERAGQSPRRFPLARVPELAGLQASFGALLAGDTAALERHYVLGADGSRERWTLTLTPKDPAVAKRVSAIVLSGGGAQLRCIETRPAGGGDAQRTLMSDAATQAAGVTDAAALAALCHGEPAR
ncbi:fatty acyl CoA synthetase [Lysobacter sp. LF1]|uniref:Fatty acyl CoA synthetase n=1 Tax=Lysobacter stagni TaxID=3045172 RepID=A0ABT6XDT0_9GAMM|nr:LolA-related protein [Lysobacter sp. LF1]MDI9238297.1 fatty acyl CoA synthetase [Lysobacter sp. LF1]